MFATRFALIGLGLSAMVGCSADDPSVSIAEWGEIVCSQSPTPTETEKSVRCQSTLTIDLSGFGADTDFAAATARVSSPTGGYVGLGASLFGELAAFSASNGPLMIPTVLERNVSVDAPCEPIATSDGVVSVSITSDDERGSEYTDRLDNADVEVVCDAGDG